MLILIYDGVPPRRSNVVWLFVGLRHHHQIFGFQPRDSVYKWYAVRFVWTGGGSGDVCDLWFRRFIFFPVDILGATCTETLETEINSRLIIDGQRSKPRSCLTLRVHFYTACVKFVNFAKFYSGNNRRVRPKLQPRARSMAKACWRRRVREFRLHVSSVCISYSFYNFY